MPQATKRNTRSSRTIIAALPLALGGGMAFSASNADDLPSRILIAKWGENEARSQGQKFYVGEKTLKVLASEQARRGWDAVPLDYDHQSVPGHANYKEHPREYAAKNGGLEVVAGEGLYYLPGDYTPSGKKYAASYQDVSGYFFLDPQTNEVIAVRSVALCEHGDVEGAEFMQAIAAAAMMGELPEAVTLAMTHARDLLEMDEESSAEDIAEGLEALVREKNQPTPKPKPPAGTRAGQANPSNPNTQVKAMADENNNEDLKKQVTDLTSTVNTLAASVTQLVTHQGVEVHNKAVDAVLAAAVSEGKVVPDELKKKDDGGKYVIAASSLEAVVKVLPVTQATEFTTPAHVAAAATATATAEKEVAATLGISEETWKKGTPIAAGNQPHGELAKKIAAAA